MNYVYTYVEDEQEAVRMRQAQAELQKRQQAVCYFDYGSTKQWEQLQAVWKQSDTLYIHDIAHLASEVLELKQRLRELQSSGLCVRLSDERTVDLEQMLLMIDFVKRSVFVILLIALFSGCFFIMYQHYDELARYPHELSEEERSLVLSHLSTEQINYLVSQKIEPEQFLPFIDIKDFELNNTLWYDVAYQTQKPSHTESDQAVKEYIVSFINRYRSRMEYGQLHDLLTNYSYNVLTRFFDEGDPNIENARLIAQPDDPYLVLSGKNTLYTYEPKNLVSINDLPHASLVPQANDITIKKEVVKPLKELLAAAREVNQKENGDMKVIAGYISYEDQMKLFEKAKLIFGDEVLQHWDYPGQSEFQLGYTVRLLPNGMTTEFDEEKENDKDKDTGKKEEAKSSDKKDKKNPSEEERDQEIWLKDNAYKFGFIIRYPKQKEDTTGKRYQPYTLRYVGKDIAKKLHDEGYVLDEVNINDLKE